MKLELETDPKLTKALEKYYRGIQMLFSPLLHKPDFLFIGINPGIGYYKFYNRNVNRFAPLQNFEYLVYDYQLARETRKVFQIAGLEPQLKSSVKTNYYFFSTANADHLYKLLSHLKHKGIYKKSQQWTEQIIDILKPKMIICEGKSVFDRFCGDTSVTVGKNYEGNYNGIPVIGYRRLQSRIEDKEGLAALLRKKFGDIERTCSKTVVKVH